MKYTDELVEFIIMLKLDGIEMNSGNIVKLLRYDAKITDNYCEWEIKDCEIRNYGICEPYPPMNFKEYIPHFVDAMCWAISGESEENTNKILKDFLKLKLTYKKNCC